MTSSNNTISMQSNNDKGKDNVDNNIKTQKNEVQKVEKWEE